MDDFHEACLLLRIGVKLHDQGSLRRRQDREIAVRTNAIRTTFALTDRFQVTGAQDTSDHLHIQVIGNRIRDVIRRILDAVRRRSSLHLAAEIVLLLTFCDRDMMVDNLLQLVLFGLHTTEPLADQFLHFGVIGVDVTHKDEGEVRRVRKARFVDLQSLVKRHLFERRGVEEDSTLRMVRAHHLYRIGERNFWILIAVCKLVLHQRDEGLICLLVTTRSSKIEIGQLHERLEILNRRRAHQLLGILRYLRINRYALTGQGFLQLGVVKTSYTGETDDGSSHLCGRQIGGSHLAHTTLRERTHQDLVRLEFRGFEHDLDTVGEDPFGDTEFVIASDGFDLAFMRCFLHKFRVKDLFRRSFDSQFTETSQCLEDRFLRGDVHTFFLRAGDGNGRVRMDERFSHFVDHIKADHRHHSLYEIVFPRNARHRFTVLEVTDALTR